MPSPRIQDLVNPTEAPPRDNLLAGYVRQLPSQMTEQLNLALSPRRKIRLTTFGRRDLIFRAIPEKNSLSQAGSSRDHSLSRMMRRGHCIQRYNVIQRQPLQPQCSSCKIIQQSYVLQPK